MAPIVPIYTAHGNMPIDAISRHEYGVVKTRKLTSTGGGRAWSEQEEEYLLQTRMQKMPYKHIAAYLKKTELACRLHYHQLSHGSNRRKRNSPDASSTGSQSPDLSVLSMMPPISSSPLSECRPTSSHQHYQYAPMQSHHFIDYARLHHIYQRRSSEFWTSVAIEYGSNMSAKAMEQCWTMSNAISRPQSPLSPSASPEPVPMPRYSRDRKMSLSSIIGRDASPQSPKEREMIRLLENGCL